MGTMVYKSDPDPQGILAHRRALKYFADMGEAEQGHDASLLSPGAGLKTISNIRPPSASATLSRSHAALTLRTPLVSDS